MPNKRPLTLSEVKALVFSRWASEQASLTSDQKRLMEYLAKFVKVEDAEAARAAVNRLVEEFNLDEEDAINLVNVIPETKDELRVFLYKSYPLLGDEAYSRILEILRTLKEGD